MHVVEFSVVAILLAVYAAEEKHLSDETGIRCFSPETMQNQLVGLPMNCVMGMTPSCKTFRYPLSLR